MRIYVVKIHYRGSVLFFDPRPSPADALRIILAAREVLGENVRAGLVSWNTDAPGRLPEIMGAAR